MITAISLVYIVLFYLTTRKLSDFKKEGERKVHPEVLQTRYDFYHNKRFYKLGEICKKRE